MRHLLASIVVRKFMAHESVTLRRYCQESLPPWFWQALLSAFPSHGLLAVSTSAVRRKSAPNSDCGPNFCPCFIVLLIALLATARQSVAAMMMHPLEVLQTQ
jgi:hypothetical protein